MFSQRIMRHRRPVIIGAQVVLTIVAYRLAFALATGFARTRSTEAVFLVTLALLVALRLIGFMAFGLHRGFYKHFGITDLIALGKAVSLGSVLFIGALWGLGLLGAVPLTVPILEWMLTLLLAGGERLAVRFTLEGRLRRAIRPRAPGTRVLVVGAGESAERLLRQVGHDAEGAMSVVALLDDDPGKQRRSLHGVPISGTIDALEDVVDRLRIGMVVIAMSSASPEQMRRVVERCLKAKVQFKRLLSMREMLQEGTRAGPLADVQLEHLLVRKPVAFDQAGVSRDLGGTVVLVTGAAGSVGSELARQIARARPAKLVLVEQAESPLYFVDLELRQSNSDIEIVPVIADITDREAMERIFAEHQPDHVYHAAAYKHVPLMECNVREAVRNNVWGTLCVAECAVQWGARKFVLISTDKAVRPSSVMGATKRIAERIVLGWRSLRTSGTEFRAVRFGNVLGSDGSVVPLFRKQLARGGPLTVTHPDVRRYFMTITEAAQLVLHAAALPDAAGRITMLDMGEPVRILDLAENLIRLSGLEPHRDVQIVFTGLRPGEKLHEELMSAIESTIPTSVEKLNIVQTDEVDGAAVQQGVERLLAAAKRSDASASLAALRALVPECVAPLRGMPVATTTRVAARERPARVVAQTAIGW